MLLTIEAFDSNLLHPFFPGMDLFQLSPGAFQGWLFGARMENCRISVGSFNQAVLVEGNYNPETFHVGFILSLGHAANVQAHEFDDGTLTIHRNAVSMHEAFPAHLAWVDIAIPEKNVPKKLPPSISERIGERSRLFLTGSRKTLEPIIRWANDALASPTRFPNEEQLQYIVSTLLSGRLDYYEEEQHFTRGDQYRMHLLQVTHELVKARNCTPSLSEICEAASMKPRTVQKYFHEIYGMGPTEYFRVRRLNRARNDLRSGSASVSEVAHRWGFPHLGRFSGRYKQHFDESPRDTLEQTIPEE